MITGLYAGLCALFAVFLVMNVVRRRFKYKVSLGDGGNDDLNRFMRAHGNFMETVPIALILMLIVELRGASFWMVHWMGILLLLGRGCHFFGLTTGKGYGKWRMAGMALTLAVYIIGAAIAIYQYMRWVMLF